jgi:hypothetical protein
MFPTAKRVNGIPFLILAILAGVFGAAASPAADSGGFKDLFDGKSLEGWKAYANDGPEVGWDKSAFSVKDGMLYCSGKGPDYWIVAPGTYADVTLKLEYKLTGNANSGVFLRVPGNARPAFTGFEVQILGDHGDDPSSHSCGAIYDVLTPMRDMNRPSGEWNQYEITNKGSQIVVILNGFKVIDADFSQLTEPIGKFSFPYSQLPKQGFIGLQNHGGEIWFRNIQIKTLQ